MSLTTSIPTGTGFPSQFTHGGFTTSYPLSETEIKIPFYHIIHENNIRYGRRAETTVTFKLTEEQLNFIVLNDGNVECVFRLKEQPKDLTVNEDKKKNVKVKVKLLDF
jgi:hypothetical protein